MSQPIMNKVFYFSNKKTQENMKDFQNILIRKLISPQMFTKPIRKNVRNLSNLFHEQTQGL